MPEPDEMTKYMLGITDHATSTFAGALDSDPDEAAESVRLGSVTGQAAPLINTDVDGFKRQYKAALGSDIIRTNSHLRDYILSDPMAAKVSHDDLGQLSKVSQVLDGLPVLGTISQVLKDFGDAAEFEHGILPGTSSASIFRMPAMQTGELSPEDQKAAEEWMGKSDLYKATNIALATAWSPVEYGLRIFGGTVHGITGVYARQLQALGMDPETVEKGRQALEFALTDPALQASMGPLGLELKLATATMRRAAIKAMPWIDARRPPPPGIDAIFDKALIEEADKDLKALDDIIAEGKAAKTSDRSPEEMMNFYNTDAKRMEFRIKAEAITKMYGDKPIASDDGLFGWIPDLAEQLKAAEGFDGGEVKTTKSEYLAHIDKEVHDAIREDLRVRSDSITLSEGEILKERQKLRDEVEAKRVEAEGERPTEIPVAPADPTQHAIDQVRMAAGFPGFPSEEPAMGAFSLHEDPTKIVLVSDKNVGHRVTTVGGATIRQALSEIALNTLADRRGLDVDHFRLIRDRIIDKAGDIKINIIRDSDWQRIKGVKGGAHYNPTYNHINIPEFEYYGKWNIPGRPPFVTLHETIHAATTRAIYQDPAFKARIRKVMNEVQAQKPGIELDYGFTNEHEFLAEALSNKLFQKLLIETRISKELAKELGIKEWRSKTTWDVIVDFIRHKFNLPLGAVSALEAALRLTEEGYEIKLSSVERELYRRHRERIESGLKPEVPMAEPRLPPPEDIRDPFGRGALKGFTNKQRSIIMDLIRKQSEEEKEAQLKRGMAEEAKRQTKEWKDLARQMRKDVRDDFQGRPDIAVSNFFKEGKLFGQKLKKAPKINASFLTDEQIASLPKDFVSKYGMNPDDIAGNFGFLTGDKLVESLVKMSKDAEASGLSFDKYVTKMIRDETAARMEYQYGKLAENVLEAAQDHVLGKTTMDILHEWVIGAAQKAGIEPSLPNGEKFTKENVKRMVTNGFRDSKVGTYKVDDLIRKMGINGAAAELLEGNPAEAYRRLQGQYIQALMAREVRKFEKEQPWMKRALKKYKKLEVPGTRPEYVHFIHDVLYQVGETPNIARPDLDRAILKTGEGTTLQQFRDNQLRVASADLPVPDFLINGTSKKLNEMTVGEWRATRDLLKVMDAEGRGQMKVWIQGEAQDMDVILSKAASTFDDLPEVFTGPNSQAFMKRTVKAYFNSMITAESLLNRLDKGNPKGWLHRLIIYPMTGAANEADALLKKTQQSLWQATKGLTKRYLDKKMVNDLWRDPLSRNNELVKDWTRRQTLAVLQNVGNAEQLEKIAGGFGLEPQQVLDWLWKNVTKEDVERAQRIGKVFKPLFDLADDMYLRMYGVPLEEIQVGKIQTKWGEMDGWYHPIAYDRYRSKLHKHGDLMDPGYTGIQLANAYTKQRTGYIGVMDLNFDVIPTRLRQMIHDISFREPIKQTDKILNHPEFKKALIQSLGQQRYNSLEGWLKWVANKDSFPSELHFIGGKALNMLIQNTIAIMIGFNPFTVGKHGLTALANSFTQGSPTQGAAFAKHLTGIVYGRSTFDATKTNWRFAIDKSQELQRRARNWNQLIKGGTDITLLNNSWRDFMINLGSSPVAMSDMLSSVPTWLTHYEAALKDGETEGMAVQMGNRAVRHAHGSSVTTNRPSIMQIRNPLGYSFMGLYGFFSHMYQKQFELAWRTKDAYQRGGAGPGLAEGLKGIGKNAPRLIAGLVSYVIIPSIVEDMFMRHPSDEKEGWGEWALTALADDLSGSLIGNRDIVKGLAFHREPQTGMMSEAYRVIYSGLRDVRHPVIATDRAHMAKTMSDATTLIGLLTGLTNSQEGKALEFITRYEQGLEHPDGIGFWHSLGFKHTKPGWLTGLKHGTIKQPARRSF